MSNQEPIKDKVTYIGKVDYRGKEITFGIKERDRTKHTYIIGKSGMGKSTLLENLAIQDINNGEGVCVVDPHGSLAEKLLDHIPESRIKDVVYFAPFDGEHPMGLNMLEKVSADKRYLLANGMMSAFKKIFTDGEGKGTFSARMEYVLNNIILALLENEGQTLLGVNRMLFDKDYRKFIVSNVTDPTVKDFWVNEYANYTEKTAQELAPAIQNKIGQFVSNPLIRNIVGQKKTSFDVRKLMDEKKILIVNLSKGKVGEGNANLLGSLLITKIYLAAMSRADVDPYAAEKLPPFYFYVDEFQNFANESFASILSEARKYKLALTVAHQYIEQMTDEVKSAVFGNVGTMITFRVGATDAEVFEKEFAPYFILDDFVNLSAYQIYLRLMIDDQGSKPFSARTLSPIQKPEHSSVQAVIAHSRAEYSRPLIEVEKEVADFYKPIVKEIKPTPVIATTNGNGNQYSSASPNTNGNGNRYATSERQLPVREIRNETIYPPKRYDDKNPVRVPVPSYHLNHQANHQVNHQVNQPEHRSEYQPNPRSTPVVEAPRPTAPVPPTELKPVVATVIPVPPPTQPLPPKETAPIYPPRPPQTQFDDKPAMSLKEALERAMSENRPKDPVDKKAKPDEINLEKPKAAVLTDKKEIPVEEKKRQEVSEEVLRKLIEEEA